MFSTFIIWFDYNKTLFRTKKFPTISNVHISTSMIPISNRRERIKIFYTVKEKDSIVDTLSKNGILRQTKIKKLVNLVKINKVKQPIIIQTNKINLKFLTNHKISILMKNLKKRKEKPVIYWLSKQIKIKKIPRIL